MSSYPLCACGCGARVKRSKCRYASVECIPREIRQAAGSKGRRTYAYRRRAMAYRQDLERLGRHPTREDLLTVFHRIYRRGYNSGFQVGRIAGATQDTGSIARARAREAA